MNSVETKVNTDLILREKLAIQRTVMANQTTLLAFIRTSMYFLVAALSVGNLLTGVMIPTLTVVLFAVSALLIILGTVNFLRHRKLIKESETHVGNYKREFLYPQD